MPDITPALGLLEDPEGTAVSGGTRRNRAYAEEFTVFEDSVAGGHRWLVTDAMTSGGLLVAVAPHRAGSVPGALVGRSVTGPAGTISVR